MVNLVKKRRSKAKLELRERKGATRPSSPPGPLVEQIEDEDFSAGMKMTDKWFDELQVCETLEDWSELVGKLFSQQSCLKDLGLALLEVVSRLPSPLGRFTREFCDSARPHPGATPTSQRGDILPIAPWRINTKIEGVTDANQPWVWLTVVIQSPCQFPL